MSSSAQDNQDAPIEVVSYRTDWPVQFEAERKLLETALSPWLVGEIEHIGSTAVPGLAAKPLIDIMAPVESLEGSLPAIEAARSLGYHFYPYMPETMHWFCKPSPAHRTHHLHLVPYGSPRWRQALAFRDALRASKELAAEYATLKFQLAERYRNDREAYTQTKSVFVDRVLSGLAKPGQRAV
ncbi:MAG: GrpB family protein [Rhizobacter sp.]